MEFFRPEWNGAGYAALAFLLALAVGAGALLRVFG
jgi:hypothetical protein